MPEYLAPGVYTEEIPTGPVPIQAVSTSTAGVVGPTVRGPLHPRLVTSWLEFDRWFGGLAAPDDPAANTTWAVRGFFDNGGSRIFVARVVGAAALPATLDLAGPTTLSVTATGPGKLDNQVFVRVGEPTARDPKVTTVPRPYDPRRVRITIAFYDRPYTPFVDPTDLKKRTDPNRREPTLLEDYDDVLIPDIEVTLLASTLVTAAFAAGAPAAPTFVDFTALAGGADGPPPVLDQYLGRPDQPVDVRQGLAGLATIDEVSLLIAPDEVTVDGLTDAVRTQCELLRYRFAVLQTRRDELDPGDLVPTFSSSYVGLYFPWIQVLDPASGASLFVPPAGHVAGVYAATDQQRGVHKAPANVELRGIVTTDGPGNKRPLAYTASKGDQDVLNPRGVNVIRDFRSEGRGIRVWGARTLADNAQWKYVNVRRLFIFVEKSVDEGTQWVVFEPNDEFTWARVVRSIENFLTTVWRNGALMGSTTEEAFQVRCDRTTMTQDDIDNGRLICTIAMAPVKPAEFVILRFSQRTVEAT